MYVVWNLAVIFSTDELGKTMNWAANSIQVSSVDT